MIKTEIKGNISFPDKFVTQDDLYEIANKFFVPIMQDGIENRESIAGGPLPKLERETIERKGDDRPLIETGKLKSGMVAGKVGKTTVRITIVADRYDIGKYLQVDGVRSKRGIKKFIFFGINPKMEKLAVTFLKNKIKEVVGKFNGK
jgi:hypothetical protein